MNDEKFETQIKGGMLMETEPEKVTLCGRVFAISPLTWGDLKRARELEINTLITDLNNGSAEQIAFVQDLLVRRCASTADEVEGLSLPALTVLWVTLLSITFRQSNEALNQACHSNMPKWNLRVVSNNRAKKEGIDG